MKVFFYGTSVGLFILLIGIPAQALAYDTPSLTVQIRSLNGTVESSFDIPTENEMGGAQIAVGDLGQDGTPEIILANGMGSSPTVMVYRYDGTEIGSFLAYPDDMRWGMNVAVCDVDGDGVNDIITTPQYGGAPEIKVFDNMGVLKTESSTMAYAENFLGGVNISCGDLNNDGVSELVTSPGPTGGPHVRIWKFESDGWKLTHEFFAFDANETNGVLSTIYKGNLLLTLQKPMNTVQQIREFSIGDSIKEIRTSKSPVHTAMSMSYADDKLLISSNPNGGIAIGEDLILTDSPSGVMNTVATDIDHDGETEIITVPGRPLFTDITDKKRIVIDLSDQRIYAYEEGILANSFLTSTARAGYVTPLGEHTVLAKVPFVHYAWSYGPGNPNNYDLGVQPKNLRIFPHIYIHYAPWHNNFGHQMSHGCINLSWENISWIYDWAEEGIPVTVQA